MIKVTVTSTAVRNMSGNAKATGKPYNLDFQTVWLHTFGKDGQPNPYPEKAEIMLDHDKDGAALFYPVGDYTLHPSSVFVGRRGDVEIAPRLVAMKPTPKAA